MKAERTIVQCARDCCRALMVPDAFGPAVAAYLVLRITGGSVRA
jgi:hypothetical protein